MTIDLATPPDWRHYLTEDPPRSAGRVLLSQALETHTLLRFGIGGQQIADAFEEGGSEDERRQVALAVALFREPLQQGRFRSWARPFGGGAAEPLLPEHWEIDDFAPRFASSSLCLARPFDASAAPTHWIFVEDAVIEALHDLCRDEIGLPRRSRPSARAPTGAEPDTSDETVLHQAALLRLPEVERLVGMKKSTIYARVAEGRFPAPVRNGERISSWRESDVREWIRQPR